MVGLINGKTENFYHYIATAMERSLLQMDDKLDLEFTLSSWSNVENYSNSCDAQFLSAVHYNHAYYLINKKVKKGR